MPSIHGHAVMHMMLEHPGGFTREELVTAIIARFGPEARFHTCSADDMTPAGVVEFLESRGKFAEADGRVHAQRDRICNHEHE